MASSPLGSVLELVIYVISASIQFTIDLFAKILGVIDSFLPGFSVGGIPFIIITVIIIGAILFFFGQHIVGTGRTILFLLLVGIVIGLVFMMLV